MRHVDVCCDNFRALGKTLLVVTSLLWTLLGCQATLGSYASFVGVRLREILIIIFSSIPFCLIANLFTLGIDSLSIVRAWVGVRAST